MNPRDYQSKAIDCVFDAWKTHPSTSVIMATGLGKTVLFAHVISKFGKRALVIAHRKELIDQAADKISKATGLKCGVEMADRYADISDLFDLPVIVASVQTLTSGRDTKRMEKFSPQDFGLIVCDEFHHSTSVSYRKIFDYFKQNKDIKFLGVTATPDRADGEALKQICESVAFRYDILDGIQDGWLVPITQQFCRVRGLDLSHIKTVRGDLDERQLAAVMEEENAAQQIVQAVIEVSYGMEPKTLNDVPVDQWKERLLSIPRSPRRSIVFMASVKAAEDMDKVLKRVLPEQEWSAWVCGETRTYERESILRRFHGGNTYIVANCGVLLEGYDNPSVECIFMARPTKSRSLYVQAVGRSTRPTTGLVDGLATVQERTAAISNSEKPFCRIIDFVGNSGRHKLICAYDILGGKVSDTLRQSTIDRAMEDGSNPKLVTVALTNEEKRIKREEEERQREALQHQRRNIVARSHYNLADVNPFGGDFALRSEKSVRPKGPPPTIKQAKLVGRFGINPTKISKKDAGFIIGKLIENKWQCPQWLKDKYAA